MSDAKENAKVKSLCKNIAKALTARHALDTKAAELDTKCNELAKELDKACMEAGAPRKEPFTCDDVTFKLTKGRGVSRVVLA